MKRLRASEQGESGASGAAGAAADSNTAGGSPVPPAGGSSILAPSIKAPLSEKSPDAQTTTPTLSQPTAARPEEQPQAPCNGDVPQMLPEGKGF